MFYEERTIRYSVELSGWYGVKNQDYQETLQAKFKYIKD